MRRRDVHQTAVVYPAWWQVETLLNGDEERRSRDVRDARRARRARARRAALVGFAGVVAGAVAAMSVASSMLEEVAAFVSDILARIGVS